MTVGNTQVTAIDTTFLQRVLNRGSEIPVINIPLVFCSVVYEKFYDGLIPYTYQKLVLEGKFTKLNNIKDKTTQQQTELEKVKKELDTCRNQYSRSAQQIDTAFKHIVFGSTLAYYLGGTGNTPKIEPSKTTVNTNTSQKDNTNQTDTSPKLENLQKELNTVTQERDQLLKKSGTFDAQIQQFQKTLSEKNELLKSKTEELSGLTKNQESLSVTLKNKIYELENESKKNENELKKLELEKTKSDKLSSDQIIKLNKKIGELEESKRQYEKLIDEQVNLKASLKDLEAKKIEFDKQASEYKNIKELYDKSQKELKQSKEEVEYLQSNDEEHEEENKKFLEKLKLVNDLNNKNVELDIKLCSLISIIEHIKHEDIKIDDYTEKLNAFNVKFVGLVATEIDLKKALKEKISEIEQNEADIELLQETNEELSENNKSLTENKKKFEELLETKWAEAKDHFEITFSKKIGDLQTEVSKVLLEEGKSVENSLDAINKLFNVIKPGILDLDKKVVFEENKNKSEKKTDEKEKVEKKGLLSKIGDKLKINTKHKRTTSGDVSPISVSPRVNNNEESDEKNLNKKTKKIN